LTSYASWARVTLCLVVTFAANCGFLPSLAWAQEPQIVVDDRGAIRSLSWQGSPEASGLFLLVPSQGWKGHLFSQESWQPDSVDRSADGRRWTIKGRAEWEGGGLEVEETIELLEARVRVVYRCRSLGTAASEGARLMFRGPTSVLAGKGAFVAARGGLALARPLPEELPSPYHLWGGGLCDWFGWRLGDSLLVARPQGDWLDAIALQDDRQFNLPQFEAQLRVKDTARLSEGHEFGCELILEPTTLAALQQEGVVVTEAENRWDTARVDLGSRGEAALGQVTWSAGEGPRWRPVELRFDVSGTWDNPFDPDEVEVYGVIRREGGGEIRQPAFACQDYKPLTSGGDVLLPEGELHWRLRWTPMEEGTYRVRLVAGIGGEEVSVDAGSYTCRGSEGRGFVRRSPDTPYYLRFDDGSPYFAVGENICWDGDDLLTQYERWFSRLGAAGGNYCRIWLVRWNMAVEWSNQDPSRRGCYYGLGRYSLDNAWRLDRVLQLAAENGIYVMLCLGYHGELMDTEDYFKSDCWRDNPYNEALGGPCAAPAAFWTNEQARELYKKRLRYYLARWGAYPNVLSWEFWNEVWAPAPWVQEMAAYLGEQDVHHHLRTTTYGRDDTWTLPEMDYSQAHHYGSDENLRDSAPVITDTSWQFTQKYGKPFMMGEFGIDWKHSDTTHDPQGLGTNLHNGLWAAVASRSFGTAALWYWDGYVDPLNLYGRFTSVARFAREVDWTRFAPTSAQVEPIRALEPPPRAFVDLEYTLDPRWAKQPDGEVAVSHDGKATPAAPSQFLFSPGKPDLCSPLRLRLDMPEGAAVTLRVERVSASAVLVVKLDGEEVARREYKCGPPDEGPYRDAQYFEEWKLWQCTFDDEVAVEIPAGSHLLELTNEAGDWMTLPRITLGGYRDATVAPMDVSILTDGTLAVGWVHDQASNWQNDRDQIPPEDQGPLRLIFRGLRDGRYQVRWYDTWQSEFADPRAFEVADGRAELLTPVFKRDIALIVKPR